MIPSLRYWLTDQQPMPRSVYIRLGLSLAALKIGVETAIVFATTGQLWQPWLHAWPGLVELNTLPTSIAITFLIWSIPFLWIGINFSARRASDAGLSVWWTLIFLVPALNYGLIAVLSFWPSATRARRGAETAAEAPAQPSGTATDPTLPNLLPALVAGVAVGLPLILLSLRVENLGAGLFLGAPFAVGVAAGVVLNQTRLETVKRTISAAVAALSLIGLLLIVIALEGFVCLLMALPLGLVLAAVGALFGRLLVSAGKTAAPGAAALLLVVPTGIVLEPSPAPELREVRSSVFVEADPLEVWNAVVAFPPLDPPKELWFRVGIAYPIRAEIQGSGVGAVRLCVFSTGAFVEPITVWDEGRRLAFDVTESPDPLRELSWRAIHPPHLDGYLRTVRGEFRMSAEADGTRLEGSTWYEQRLRPEPYWAFFSDRVIARIHDRVLDHVARVAETSES